MKTYIVTDPNGVLVGGKRIKESEKLPTSAQGSLIKALVRFKQIKEEGEKTSVSAGPRDPAKTEEPPVAPQGDEGRDEPKLESATDYKQALDKLGVKYKGNASTESLKELFEEATAE